MKLKLESILERPEWQTKKELFYQVTARTDQLNTINAISIAHQPESLSKKFYRLILIKSKHSD